MTQLVSEAMKREIESSVKGFIELFTAVGQQISEMSRNPDLLEKLQEQLEETRRQERWATDPMELMFLFYLPIDFLEWLGNGLLDLSLRLRGYED